MATPKLERVLSHGALDALIRAGLIAVLAALCYRVFQPFMSLMLWAVILAVMLYPLHRKLLSRLGGNGRTATLIVVLGVALMLVPVYLLGVSIAESARGATEAINSGNFHIPPPADSVADWPVVGDRLHAAWSQASNDLTGLAQKFLPEIKAASKGMLGKLAGVGIGLLLFMGALIIAGIIMAYGEAGHRSSIRIASRIFGAARGEQVTRLCVATIRAVAQGVVGIALIQMLLVGIGFVLMGVPGAGLLALGVLLLGIMQLPATILTLPVIIYMLSTQEMTAGMIALAIFVFVAGLVDNVLKPLLLGRGVEVPMPVVLIGALGGMVAGGILGLFIGPVMLSVGYVLFWQWVAQEEEPSPVLTAPPTATSAAPAPTPT